MTAAIPAGGTPPDIAATDSAPQAPAPDATSAPDAAPSEVVPLEQPHGRLSFFLQCMFGLTLLAALYTMAGKSDWLNRIPGMMLFGIGVMAIVATRRLSLEALARVELHATSIRVFRRGGRQSEVSFRELLLVRKDVGPDDELAYFLQFDGDRHLRLRPPAPEQSQALQTFVERLAERAGFTWTGTHAKRG